jgi:polygalacturonase
MFPHCRFGRLVAGVACVLGPFGCGNGASTVTSSNQGASGGTTSGSGSGSGGSNSGGASGGGSDGGGGSSGGSAGAGSGGSTGTARSGSGTGAGTSGSGSDAGGSTCGTGDPNLPAEPTIPPACATLTANKTAMGGTLASADESTPDTARIQAAIGACASGQAVKLMSNGASNAFLTGPLTLAAGVTLWVDANTTLFASRNPRDFDTSSGACGATGSSNGCKPLISARVAGAGIVGDGVIDGRGGEPMLGSNMTWWDVSNSTTGSYSNPRLIEVTGAKSFTLYRITLHNSPNFHVVLGSQGFVVWGVTLVTPSSAANSQGKTLTPVYARNTDGIDPAGASNGYIVCSKISDGDDQIAIKGGSAVSNLVIAHNHLGAGHGMSIGSETNGGVSGIKVYDLSIDGTNSGMGGGSSNGIRIKSDSSRGGLVTNVSYSDVCVRGLANPIILSPNYSSATGSLIPQYTGITIQNFRSLSTSVTPTVTLDGYDSTHITHVTLDNVVVDGLSPSMVKATNANVILGPGNVNFTPSGSNVAVTNAISGTTQPNACAGKWVTF